MHGNRQSSDYNWINNSGKESNNSSTRIYSQGSMFPVKSNYKLLFTWITLPSINTFILNVNRLCFFLWVKAINVRLQYSSQFHSLCNSAVQCCIHKISSNPANFASISIIPFPKVFSSLRLSLAIGLFPVDLLFLLLLLLIILKILEWCPPGR